MPKKTLLVCEWGLSRVARPSLLHMAKLWVVFFTSLLLVSAMNFYAVIREPDMIEIDEIRNFPHETVKIEGILTGYVRDPYERARTGLTYKFRKSMGTLLPR